MAILYNVGEHSFSLTSGGEAERAPTGVDTVIYDSNSTPDDKFDEPLFYGELTMLAGYPSKVSMGPNAGPTVFTINGNATCNGGTLKFNNPWATLIVNYESGTTSSFAGVTFEVGTSGNLITGKTTLLTFSEGQVLPETLHLYIADPGVTCYIVGNPVIGGSINSNGGTIIYGFPSGPYEPPEPRRRLNRQGVGWKGNKNGWNSVKTRRTLNYLGVQSNNTNKKLK